MDRSTRDDPVGRVLAEREDSGFFRDLTPDLKDEFRERWRADLERHQRRQTVDVRGLRRCVAQGVTIHLIDAILLDVPTLVGVSLALVLGSLVGGLWWKARAGYLRGILFALPGWVLMKWAGGLVNVYAMLFGSVIFVTLCAVAGLLRDLRRDDGGNGL
jgi:hypothetical protein